MQNGDRGPDGLTGAAHGGARLIVAANRGPAQFYQRADGKFVARQASGGLATAFVSLAAGSDLSWIAVAGNAAERHAFEEKPQRIVRIGPARVDTRYVSVPDRIYKLYYNDVSNSTLWFAQHYLFHPDLSPDFGPAERQAWNEGYVTVNRLVADAVIEEWQGLSPAEQARAIVMIQDYQLYLVPGMLRESLPGVTQSHFVHIPWPAVRYWQMLPQAILEQILASMLTNNVVGLQTAQDVANFLACVAELQPQANISREETGDYVTWHGHRVLVKAYPIGINPDHIRTLAHSRAAKSGFAGIAHYFTQRRTILRVDRLEPTKNIIRGLEAFETLLDQHERLRGEVRFVMMLVPSREGVKRYRDYARKVHKLMQKINAKYGTPDDPAVVHVLGNDQARALAAMRVCDVLLVNSVIDGMHLGAKEAAVVNERQGVLVISRTAGVYQQLGDGAALGVAPLDVQETADALYRALTMPPAERAALADEACRRVEDHDVFSWLEDQLVDARRMAKWPARLTRPTLPAPATPVASRAAGDLALVTSAGG